MHTKCKHKKCIVFGTYLIRVLLFSTVLCICMLFLFSPHFRASEKINMANWNLQRWKWLARSARKKITRNQRRKMGYILWICLLDTVFICCTTVKEMLQTGVNRVAARRWCAPRANVSNFTNNDTLTAFNKRVNEKQMFRMFEIF